MLLERRVYQQWMKALRLWEIHLKRRCLRGWKSRLIRGVKSRTVIQVHPVVILSRNECDFRDQSFAVSSCFKWITMTLPAVYIVSQSARDTIGSSKRLAIAKRVVLNPTMYKTFRQFCAMADHQTLKQSFRSWGRFIQCSAR